ncbi:hypothetical protein ACTXT7_004804 [Hymenolepis weldensis]
MTFPSSSCRSGEKDELTLTCAKQIPDAGQRQDRPKGLSRIPKMDVSYFDGRCYSQQMSIITLRRRRRDMTDV